MTDKEADISLLRTPIQISGKPVEQVLNSIHYGSPELRCLLMDECDLIFECKVCRALFRDLPNFISHKRAYCTKSVLDMRHVSIANLPEEKVVVIQPQAPEETRYELPSASQQPKIPRPSLEQTILRIQSGELGNSHAYKVYTEAAEKLQKQKEGMKVATIRTTAIPTNKNAVFIDVNMASVNIHERQQQVSSGIISQYDQQRSEDSVTLVKRKAGDRLLSTRNVRKSTKQERQSAEPQQLLMEQLKEIQHKVKQKVAASHDKALQHKKVRGTTPNIGSQKDIVSSSTATAATSESSQRTPTIASMTRAQKKATDSSGRKVLSSDNLQPALVNDEDTKDDSDPEEVKYALVKQKIDVKIRSKAAKENKSLVAMAVSASTRRNTFAKRVPVCSKCNSVFATRKSLHYHEKIHHSAKRTFYPCPYCSSVFYYFFGITRHLFRNHSKPIDEINAMRKQLREISYTKPLPSPLINKISNGNTPSSGRSTRSLGRNQVLNVSHDVASSNETLSHDKQPSRRPGGDGEVAAAAAEASSKVARQKMTAANSTQAGHSSKISGPVTHDTTRDAASMTPEQDNKQDVRAHRFKNKQQQKAGESTLRHLLSAPAGVMSPVSSSQISTSYDISHLCPKCHRGFRRKISCKNHMKVCKAKSSGSVKSVKVPNTRLKRQVLLPESSPAIISNKHLQVKNKNISSPALAAEQRNTSPVKVTEKTDLKVGISLNDSNDSPRRINSRSNLISSIDRSSSQSQRTSSVDRSSNQSQRTSSVDRSSNQSQRTSSVDRSSNQSQPMSSVDRSSNQSQRTSSVDRSSNQSQRTSSVDRSSNQSQPMSSVDQSSNQSQRTSSVDRSSNQSQQSSSVDKSSSQSQRASSVDRTVKRESRNRSRDRSSTSRDDRDSSVESTHSNTDGKSPRNRRNILLRYAAATQPSKSASTLEAGAKSDISSDSCVYKSVKLDVINDTHDRYSGSLGIQQSDTNESSSEVSDNFAHNIGHKTSRDNTGDSILKIESASMDKQKELSWNLPTTPRKTRMAMQQSLGMNQAQDVPNHAESETTFANLQNPETLLEISPLPCVISNVSPEKFDSSVHQSEVFLQESCSENTSEMVQQSPSLAEGCGLLPRELSQEIPARDDSSVNISAIVSGGVDVGNSRSRVDSESVDEKTEDTKTDIVDSGTKLKSNESFMKNVGGKLDNEVSDNKLSEGDIIVQEGIRSPTAGEGYKVKDMGVNLQQMGLLGHSQMQQQSLPWPPVKMPLVENGAEHFSVVVKIESHENKALTVEDEALQLKKPELVFNQPLALLETGSSGDVNNVAESLKKKEMKAPKLSAVAVVSALSDRPKRKRKVPSRNKDAEEMFSKIHNQVREAVPVKKRKIIPDMKVDESSRKRLKGENAKLEMVAAAEPLRNNQHVHSRMETHSSKWAHDDKDESSHVDPTDDDSDDELGKRKGRSVSNRMYAVEKQSCSRKRLKCYDQMKVYRMVDESQLKCLECGERFSQLCNLRRHVIRQHLKWSRFKCKLCKFESYDRSECATHLIRSHKNKAVSLRNVHQFIIDLVKQGSQARNLKKHETLKVKHQVENKGGNIYARPTVKNMIRMQQRVKVKTSSAAATDENIGNKTTKSIQQQTENWNVQVLAPPLKSSATAVLTPTVVTMSKQQINILTSSPPPPKAEALPTQFTQQQVSSKNGSEPSVVGKSTRKVLPFNISTRNSPRTFDTRPYNPVGDDLSDGTESVVHKLQPLTAKKDNPELTVSEVGKISQKPETRSSSSQNRHTAGSSPEHSSTTAEKSGTDGVQKVRNAFETINTRTDMSSSPTACSLSVHVSPALSKVTPSNGQGLAVSNSSVNHPASPKVIEVKVQSPKTIMSYSNSQILQQTSDITIKKTAGVQVDKPNIIGYVFKGLQPGISHALNDTSSPGQGAKPTFKLAFTDQVSLSSPGASPLPQAAKINLPPGKLKSAQIIDSANLQRKHASSSTPGIKSITLDSVKVAPKGASTSKETTGCNSGISLAAALTKGGHIFTTVATSFIVNHGQAGKFIVYTRPSTARDSTTVTSVTRQTPVSSPSPSSSAGTSSVKTSDSNLQTDSPSPATVTEDVLLPGTFAIHKHYL